MIPLAGWVAPFGDPGITDRSHLPRAFRSVPRPSSPLSAKASTRCPCFALDHRIAVTGDAAPPPRTGPNPMPASATAESGGLYEDTSLGQPQAKLGWPRPVRLGHITTLSSPFNQPRRGRPRRCRSIFSERRARAGAANRQHLSVQLGCTCRQQKLKLWQSSALPVVEVNGFEPMTSCLQSRRSPS